MESSWAIFTTTLVAMQMTGDQRRPLLTMAPCSSSFVVSAVAGGKKDSFCGIFLSEVEYTLLNRHKVMMC